jgi:hypothetical protein
VHVVAGLVGVEQKLDREVLGLGVGELEDRVVGLGALVLVPGHLLVDADFLRVEEGLDRGAGVEVLDHALERPGDGS